AAAIGRDRIQVHPAILLRGEHDAVAGGELECAGLPFVQSAVRSIRVVTAVPDLPSLAVGGVAYPDRPCLCLAGQEIVGISLDADECQPGTVGRPPRQRVVEYAGCDVTHGGVAQAVNADQVMGAATADEGDLFPIRRPARLCVVSADIGERTGSLLPRNRCQPQLV